MVFSSSLFLLAFLPFFLLAYYICPNKLKNIVLLVASLFFYSWGAPSFVFILLISLVIDFYLVRLIQQKKEEARYKILCCIVVLNVGLLAYFKYANFFIENVNSVLISVGVHSIAWTSVALPIGISFITFHKLTYAIDAYRNVHKPLEKFSDYALYIIMFPHQIAGPIVRFNEIADQIVNREKEYTIDNRLNGMIRFIIGLSKKVLIANPLGNTADSVFAIHIGDLSSLTAWIGILSYTFQIYFDFSGYSDMAIGLAKMIGFTFPENFDNPYISNSITEFWRRWHITLGRWMRDYLYIPLGGNKVKTKVRLYFNLWIVFILSGLWHGASWNFIIWGAFHGIFLILDRIFILDLYKKNWWLPSKFITFVTVVIGWVFFRTDNLQSALSYIKKMFAFDFHSENFYLLNDFYFVFILAILFSFGGMFRFSIRLQNQILYGNYNNKEVIVLGTFSLLLLFLSITSIVSSGFNPFIYYRF